MFRQVASGQNKSKSIDKKKNILFFNILIKFHWSVPYGEIMKEGGVGIEFLYFFNNSNNRLFHLQFVRGGMIEILKFVFLPLG